MGKEPPEKEQCFSWKNNIEKWFQKTKEKIKDSSRLLTYLYMYLHISNMLLAIYILISNDILP